MGYEDDLRKVREDWRNLQYIENQTEELCLEAVKQDKDAIKYMDKNILLFLLSDKLKTEKEQEEYE